MPLDQPSQGGPPAAYFPTVGDTIVIGIIDIREYQQRDYETEQLVFWPDGNPKMGKELAGLVVSTSGTTRGGSASTEIQLTPGDIVRFFCEGSKWIAYRDALNAHGPVDTGDVMRWERLDDQPASSAKFNDRHVFSARIRGPKPEDGDLKQRCEAARREYLRGKTLDSPQPAERPAEPAQWDDEAPF